MVKKKKPLAILVTGIGPVYLDYTKKMMASLIKTNPDIQTKADIVLMTDKEFYELGGTQDHMLYMTPWFTKHLLKDYECVVRIDSDMIITGDISSCWEGDFDVAVVNNANPRELKAQINMMGTPVTVWTVKPEDYVNCGFVVVKSEKFVDHWLKFCTPENKMYRMYEQDFLNILTFYCDYKVKFLDFEPKVMGQYVLQIVPNEDKDKFWNLASKGYWSEVILKDKKLVLPKNSGSEIDPWPDNDKTLVGIHFAGGVLTGKFDHLDTQFDPPVAHYLKYLISDGQKT